MNNRTAILVAHGATAATAAGLTLVVAPVVWTLIPLLPLLALVPGLTRLRIGTLRLAAILLVLYLGFGLTETVANPDGRYWGAALILAATAEIALIILAIRSRS